VFCNLTFGVGSIRGKVFNIYVYCIQMIRNFTDYFLAMQIQHKALIDLLKMAYSAEKAAAFAYIGHADSIKDLKDRQAIQQIELDEWNHRSEVMSIMQEYQIQPSKYYEFKFHIIGKAISASCYVIGWFMPFYFAGDLESGNVCEYFRMKQYFNSIGITKHDQILYEMAIKEKEHEVYFYERIKHHRLLPFFERVFKWGKHAKNNVDMEHLEPVDKSDMYCVKK